MRYKKNRGEWSTPHVLTEKGELRRQEQQYTHMEDKMSRTLTRKYLGGRVDYDTAMDYEKAYGGANKGATRALRYWPTLRDKTIKELFSLFEIEELMTIIWGLENYEAITGGPALMAYFLKEAGVGSGYADRIGNLSFCQIFFLAEMAEAYHNLDIPDIVKYLEEIKGGCL